MCAKKDKELHILKGITGYAESGECLAIMGGSGAGKSTLLNILAGRFEVESNMSLEGEVLLNGHKMSWSEYKNIIGFVMQRDIFFESLKVNEIFRLVVDLTSDDKSNEWKNEFLKDIVKNLKMERAQNTQVGGDLLKGISGGEKRRLNIGFELLRKP